MGNHVGVRGLRDRDETNALSHPHPPHDQPHPSRPTGTPASSPSVLPTFTNLHATYGYITLPGPHQTPQPRPPSDLPKSPKPTEAHTSQTNPTGPATSTPTPRTPCCPAHTRRPDLASASLMRSKRRPPHPKHPKFTQFHRSGLHFGRTHPQHRQYGDISKAYGLAAVSVGDGAWPDIGNDAPNHTSTTCPTGMEGAGGHGWPGPTAPGIPAGPSCGARGRRQGLAGQRADAPSGARSADGSRAAGPSSARNTRGA